MDLGHALKVAIQTGKVKIGVHETVASAKARRAKLLIVSTSVPFEPLQKEGRFERVPVYHFTGTSVELGAACGKPFPISALAILDPGSSAILSLET
jgi:large subunit ribosomal protein L30e